MTATPRPRLETGLYVVVGILHRPMIDSRQMRDGTSPVPSHARETDMLDFMAGRTEGYESHQRLNVMLVIVGEYLVTFDRPLLSTASANLADIASATRCETLESFPLRCRDVRANVAIPGRTRHQLDGQKLFHSCKLSFTLRLRPQALSVASRLRSWHVACTSRPAR